MEVFLLSDRYIWYSQDFCEGFVVTVINNTRNSKITRFQINHRENEIITIRIKQNDSINIINFDYPIYPCEEFAIYWKQKED